MAWAEMTLWARTTGIRPDQVRAALWKRRTLVKTWAMRGTLHLLPSADLPLFTAALGAALAHHEARLLDLNGISSREMLGLIEAIPVALDGRCLTREELASEVVRVTRLFRVEARLRTGWGGLLKPAARRGYLCFGPNRGPNVTFCRPDQWLNGWREVDPEAALREIARRYLAAYGPATHLDLAAWSGMEQRRARLLLLELGEEVEPVDVDGLSAWALKAGPAWPARAPAGPDVRLLPGFDAYVMGSSGQLRRTLSQVGERRRVFRKAGWVSPVLLVDGRVRGVWAQQRRGSRFLLTIELFDWPGRRRAPLQERLAREADRLSAFLDAPVALTYAA